MRYAARADANQPAIMAAARKLGAAVQSLHRVGSGCPDILIAYRGQNILVEIKDGAKSASQRKLTPQQETWHAEWTGPIWVVKSVDELVDRMKEL